MTKLDEVLARSAYYFDARGDDGLAEQVQSELDRAEPYLHQWIHRDEVLATRAD
jgi:hypothetical protein